MGPRNGNTQGKYKQGRILLLRTCVEVSLGHLQSVRFAVSPAKAEHDDRLHVSFHDHLNDVVAGRRTYVTLQRIGLLPLFYHSSPDLSFLLFVALCFLRRPSVNPLLRKFLLFEVAFFVDNQIDRDHPRLPDKHSAAVERVDNRYRQRERARKKVQKTIPIYVIISMIFTCL